MAEDNNKKTQQNDAENFIQALIRSRDELIADVSKNVRNASDELIEALQRLEETPLTSNQHSHLESAREAAKSLFTMINEAFAALKIKEDNLLLREKLFLLKRIHSSEDLKQAQYTPLALDSVPAPPPNPLRILVVDDVEPNSLIIGEILSAEGHCVQLAANGAEALEAVRHNDFDIVFMDVYMPVMDGLEATRQIRALDGPKSEVVIVAMTGADQDDEQEACLIAGMNDFLAKPVDFDVLLQNLARWFPVTAAVPTTHISTSANANTHAMASEGMADPDDLGVDYAALDQMVSDTSSELTRKLVGLFVVDARKRIDMLREGVLTCDWELVKLGAHSLAGSSRSFGLPRVASLAKAIERQCRIDVNEASIRSSIDRFVSVAERDLLALNGFISS